MKKKHLWLAVVSLILLQNYAFCQSKPNLEKWGMNMGLNLPNWAKVPTGVTVKTVRNYGFDLSLIRRISLVKRLKLGIGLGLSNINIHNNVFHWEFDSAGQVPSNVLLNKSDYRRNKISLTYLEIPIELSIRLGGEDKTTFRIAAGFNGGVLIDAHTKLVQMNTTVKVKDTRNFNSWRYGPTLRLTVGKIGLYGRYDLSSSFDAKNVPDYPVYTIGVVFSGS